MKKYFLIANQEKDPDLSISRRLWEIMEEKGCVCLNKDDMTGPRMRGDGHVGIGSIPPGTECIISLGGDGTIIQSFRDTYGLDIPILGINIGTLGYLTELEPEMASDAFAKLAADDYQIEERMLLSGTILRDGRQVDSSLAMNDIVMARTGPLRILSFQISVNGRLLFNTKADGIIVCTPTGSTGYNISAGGPVVEPSAQLMVITPICAHDLKLRSIVLSAGDSISIKPMGRHLGDDMQAECSFDGAKTLALKSGDEICISGSKSTMKLVKLSKDSFMQVLQNKMGE